MARTNLRLRIDDTGGLEVVDPGFDTLPLLREIDPGFCVQQATLPGFTAPRVLAIRKGGCGLTFSQIARASEAALWEAHKVALERWRVGNLCSVCSPEEASILDLKSALVRRMLEHCRLCAHCCGVDRTRGEWGVCRLGTEAVVAEHFVHIAEEAPLNPSLVLNLAGCGLRCRFCQQGALLNPTQATGAPLTPALWDILSPYGARSLSFVGGNPDESLDAILRFLAAIPVDWQLPIVWNCHAYGTLETVELLEGVVDAYVPDFKYGTEACGRRLSGVRQYPATAQVAVAAMLAQRVPVIVRILVLPGHFECCHAPVLDWLATLKGTHLFISVRGQYCPDWQISFRDGALARRPQPEEIEVVRARARHLGLSLLS
jgi:putative pyruvate formate lyase activating enzyme